MTLPFFDKPNKSSTGCNLTLKRFNPMFYAYFDCVTHLTLVFLESHCVCLSPTVTAYFFPRRATASASAAVPTLSSMVSFFSLKSLADVLHRRKCSFPLLDL